METRTIINIIAALGKNRAIGKDNSLLWHIPDDMKRFKALTMGHPVIMGRKTFDSIVAALGKPLPGRTNIVITRDTAWNFAGAVVAHSLGEALEKAPWLAMPEKRAIPVYEKPPVDRGIIIVLKRI